jgi:hypothetical protein
MEDALPSEALEPSAAYAWSLRARMSAPSKLVRARVTLYVSARVVPCAYLVGLKWAHTPLFSGPA